MNRRALAALAFAWPGMASQAAWRAATDEVSNAAQDPVIAAVLRQVDRLDAAVVADDGAAFQAALAADLVVNTPQNTVSLRARTVGRGVAGQISYARYERVVEYAGTRGDMVVLMGEERVVPKGSASNAGAEVRRRFTDLWCLIDNRWQLVVRQATVIGTSP